MAISNGIYLILSGNFEVMHSTYLLIGGNLGNRPLMLSQALKLIRERIGRIVLRSSVYETEPWGFEDSRQFLNQAIKVETPLSPAALLSAILQIELVLGRIRHGDQYASRVIDIDILFYDDLIISLKHLTVPHPLMHTRRFVLVPLAEIAPNLLHPVLDLSIQQLLVQCPDQNLVIPVEIEPEYGLTPKPRRDR